MNLHKSKKPAGWHLWVIHDMVTVWDGR